MKELKTSVRITIAYGTKIDALLRAPWAIVHARLGHIPFKRYEQLLKMAGGVPRIADDMPTYNLCAGCCMGKMRAADFPHYPANMVKSTSVLELVYTNLMGPMQTRLHGGGDIHRRLLTTRDRLFYEGKVGGAASVQDL
ncbi:unnamed protein product [Phytophthora fragariaefolia]|uniref:Unnamed protein product n=1 Tax=Phytophthora fragariaefolia TaxID=1490495 RepID=A0A9W6XNV6_9STRA|nr:unnamed protein product [Phytophthora fragariaefolia]